MSFTTHRKFATPVKGIRWATITMNTRLLLLTLYGTKAAAGILVLAMILIVHYWR